MSYLNALEESRSKRVSQFDVTTSLHRTFTSSLSKMAAKSHRFGRGSPVFREPLLESADSEFVPIIHLYKMSKMESGSLI